MPPTSTCVEELSEVLELDKAAMLVTYEKGAGSKACPGSSENVTDLVGPSLVRNWTD
jgi:hypothetical protein